MEYLIEFDDATAPDPENPLRAPGAFGDKSVIEFQGTRRPPGWTRARARGTRAPRPMRGRGRAAADGRLWSPPGADPDGRARCWSRTTGPSTPSFGSRCVAARRRRRRAAAVPGRAAAPGRPRRDLLRVRRATPRAVARVLPALRAPSARPEPWSAWAPASARSRCCTPTGAARRRFGGLFLQSGSFFRPRSTAQEAGLPRASRRIARFVARRAGGAGPARADPGDDDLRHRARRTSRNNRTSRRRSAARASRWRSSSTATPTTGSAWRDALHPHLRRATAER